MTSEQLLAEIFRTYSNMSGGCCVQYATFNDHMLNRFWPEYQKLLLAKPVTHSKPKCNTCGDTGFLIEAMYGFKTERIPCTACRPVVNHPEPFPLKPEQTP